MKAARRDPDEHPDDAKNKVLQEGKLFWLLKHQEWICQNLYDSVFFNMNTVRLSLFDFFFVCYMLRYICNWQLYCWSNFSRLTIFLEMALVSVDICLLVIEMHKEMRSVKYKSIMKYT